jgi:hypothetical protein
MFIRKDQAENTGFSYMRQSEERETFTARRITLIWCNTFCLNVTIPSGDDR